MQNIMIDLAEYMGFNFVPQTFQELVYFIVLSVGGLAIICSIIKVVFYLACNTGRLAR